MGKLKASFLFVFGVIFSVISVINAQSLFIFGDSLYDVGNQQFFLGANKVPSNSWPYGESLDAPTGRWSDGKIIPDVIAKFLEIPEIPPALDSTASLSYGANFAINGSTVLGIPINSMNFSSQVQLFKGLKSVWTDDVLSKGIFMIYIGADDYLNFVKENPNPTSAQQIAKINAVVDEIVTNIKAIHAAGGKKFSIQNLAPLGCLPIVMQDYKAGNTCVPLLSSIAKTHNTKLLSALTTLEGSLSEFKYIYFDYYGSILRRRESEHSYRYFSAKVACCGTGTHRAFGCGYSNVHSKLCEFPRGYLFFDGRNHAEKSNQAFGQLIWSADPVVVSPNNLRELYVFPTTFSLGVELEQVEESSGLIALKSSMWRSKL